MTNKVIVSTILFAAVLSLVFSQSASAQQVFLSNEQQAIDPTMMDFFQFMQFMKMYEEMFGKDYVKKIYKEYNYNHDDDDDDDDDKKKKKKHYDKDWWKHNSVDLYKDKKKYCEGKGEWKNGKCVTDNDEEETAWEDAVCDNNPKKSKFCDRDSKDKEDDEKDKEEEDDKEDEAIDDIIKEEESEAEEEEEEEPEQDDEQEDEEEEDEDEDDDSDDDSSDEGGESEEE